MAQSYELKPCPCCGGEANLRFYGDPHCTVIAIVCDECRLGTRVVALDDYLSAVNAWNARAERTCRMEYQRGSDNPRRGWWLCDSCDGLTDSVGSGWNGEKQRMNPPLYCSRCGRRVVE